MDQSSPAVSVIIPAFAAAPWLGEALASLQAQSVAEWEALVVDDGDRKIAQVVRPFAGDKRFRLVETEHGGASAARNRGIALARAPLISMLDGDDRYRPDYLERMIAAIRADPQLGFVTCDAHLFGAPQFDGKLFSAVEPQSGDISLERVVRRQFKVFGSSIVRREVLTAMGGYDEQLPAAEDMDLWIRILAAGWGAARVDRPLVEYRRRAGSLSADSLSLGRADVSMYEKAARLLEGRAEGRAAGEMLERAQEQLRGEEGFAAVAQGRTREGVKLLRSSDLPRRSPKWRLALAAFALFPPLAKPVLRFYTRRHPFYRDQQAGAS
jgi:glycosyltransferase involved in cell wall biosynthesis